MSSPSGDDAPDLGDQPLPGAREVDELLAWLAAEKGRAPSTLSAYRRDLTAYLRWLADRGSEPLGAGEADVEDHVAHLRAQGLAPASVARHLVAVRSLHRFMSAEGMRADDPAAAVGRPRVPAALPKALSEEEVERLLGAVAGDDARARRDRAILEVLYGTGLRISELVRLDVADLDLESATLRAFGKGSKERIVPVGRMARAAVEEWLAPEGRGALTPKRWARRGDAEAVFLNHRGGRLTRQGAWGVVRVHGERVGLAGRLSPHVLRHSCATHMLEHGADIRAVQELLGHASISTTQVYTRVTTGHLRAVYEAAHPRARRSAQG